MRKQWIGGLILGLICTYASAGNSTIVLEPKVKINHTCSIKVYNMDFGEVSPTIDFEGAALGAVYVLCSNGTNYSVVPNAGYSGNINDRKMKHSTSNDTLSYTLYSNIINKTKFDDTETGKINYLSNGKEAVHFIRGTIDDRQFVREGSYSDTVLLTLVW